MAFLEIEYESLLIRIDDDVCELFWLESVPKSVRIPLSRLGVRINVDRKNRAELSISVVPSSEPLYAVVERGKSRGYCRPIDRAAEPRFRAFFTQTAALARRATD